MKIIIIVCIFTFLQLTNLSAQQIPTIIPPSPQAQAFMRYGEIPVDYSTGVPSIEIPIYTIEGKKLKLPISISYHASGIKVNDIASEVGLGWVLNCGGMVSRTIMGLPDEEGSYKPYMTAYQLIDSVNAAAAVPYDNSIGCSKGMYNLEYFLENSYQEYDNMSDRFSYNLPNGTSGVFRFDYLNTDTIITLPYRPLKIEKVLDVNPQGHNRIASFKITDENGIVSIFQPFLNNATHFFLNGI
jgi:hypothetical protein